MGTVSCPAKSVSAHSWLNAASPQGGSSPIKACAITFREYGRAARHAQVTQADLWLARVCSRYTMTWIRRRPPRLIRASRRVVYHRPERPPLEMRSRRRAETEFQRVTGIARTMRGRGELSAGAYAAILERARKSRDSADDAPGTAQDRRQRRHWGVSALWWSLQGSSPWTRSRSRHAFGPGQR